MTSLVLEEVESLIPEKRDSLGRLAWKRFRRHRAAMVSLWILGFMILAALLASPLAYWLGLNPDAQDILNRYAAPSHAHWLGTDETGRDVLLRLLFGAQVSLGVALLASTGAVVIGILVGAFAGFFGRWTDTILMRVTDALLTLPLLPVLILLAALDFSKLPVVGAFFEGSSSVLKMIFIFVLFSWMTVARLVRGSVLSIKNQDFVMAAQALGMRPLRVLFREILPVVMGPVVVAVTLGVGQTILFESALSFLGLGVQPPVPSWGNMLSNALETVYSAPMLVVAPGLMILLVVICFNFVGDGLQDALDPKSLR